MPVNQRSITLMSASGTNMNAYSTVAKADSYYGYTDGNHTIQITYSSFEGKIRIQGTLSLDPVELDWFDIDPGTVHGTAFTTDSTGTFVEFSNSSLGSGSEAYTFVGNYTFIRVYMDRTLVGDGANYSSAYGQVNRVLMSN